MRALLASSSCHAADADDVAQIYVHATKVIWADQELDAAAPVDQVEEHELSHVTAGENASRHAMRLVGLRAGLELICLGADRDDLFPIREAFRKGRHPREPNGRTGAPLRKVRLKCGST